MTVRSLLVVLALLLPIAGCAAPEAAERVRQQALERERQIQSPDVATISLAWTEESEAQPPRLTFFVQRGRLLAVRVQVGHETWSSESLFLFDDGERPLKYERRILGRSPAPAPEVIVFGSGGEVLEGNVPRPQVEAARLVELHRSLLQLRRAVSRY